MQAFNGPEQIEYLSYKDNIVDGSSVRVKGAPKRYIELKISLGEQKGIQKRLVYSFLQFMEDLGGFFGVMYAFGAVFNFLFQCKNPSVEYLTHYFEDKGIGGNNSAKVEHQGDFESERDR